MGPIKADLAGFLLNDIVNYAFAQWGANDLRYRLMTGKIKISRLPADEPAKRKRGRPSKGGEPILVRLGSAERAVAESLGGGVIAEGIRLALVAAGRIGESTVRILASKIKTED